MSCYAPLFVNVNPGGMQWKSDLIGYNAVSSYGSPSYYAQKMFNSYLGDKIITVNGENIPLQTRKPTKKDSLAGITPKPFPSLFYVATRDSKTGMLFIKIVNASGKAQPVTIDLQGAGKIAGEGTLIVLKSDKPEDTNTIDDPLKIIPVSQKVKNIGKTFTRVFNPWSINVLQLQVR
jgi:alpha-N-arabinofuranosidase